MFADVYVYEFPLRNKHIFDNKNINNIIRDVLYSKLIELPQKIINNDIRDSAFICKNSFAHKKYESCDPVNISFELSSTIKNIYDHRVDHYNFSLLEWTKEIFGLPEFNTEISDEDTIKYYSCIKPISLTKEIFEDTFNKFNEIIKKSLDDKINGNINIFYAQKLCVSIKSNVIFFGDFHGTIHTFLRSLLRLKIMGYIDDKFRLDKNIYIIFLGDIVDRGIYSCELLYTIMKMKTINPTNIYICRGNHETCQISSIYGFKHEINHKYGDYYQKVCESWNFLPSAIFLHNNISPYFIQLCHGGLYRDVNVIKNFLLDKKQKYLVIKGDYGYDFIWSDFICGHLDESQQSNICGRDNNQRGIGRIYTGMATLNYFIKSDLLVGIIRGHQDLFNNTKLVTLNEQQCSTLDKNNINGPIDWKKLYENNKTNFNMPLSNNIYSTRLSIPSYENLIEYSNSNFLPIYTFSTAVSARFINSDGFGIMIFFDKYKYKYQKYKNKYAHLRIK